MHPRTKEVESLLREHIKKMNTLLLSSRVEVGMNHIKTLKAMMPILDALEYLSNKSDRKKLGELLKSVGNFLSRDNEYIPAEIQKSAAAQTGLTLGEFNEQKHALVQLGLRETIFDDFLKSIKTDRHNLIKNFDECLEKRKFVEAGKVLIKLRDYYPKNSEIFKHYDKVRHFFKDVKINKRHSALKAFEHFEPGYLSSKFIKKPPSRHKERI